MRKIAIILISVLLVTLVTGCSKQGQKFDGTLIESKQAVTSTEPKQAETSVKPDPVEESIEQNDNDMAIPGDARVYLNNREITDHNLFPTPEMANTYKEYAGTNNDQLLKGLTPIDVLRLYNKACDDNNVEMQVSLIELPPEITKTHLIQEIKAYQVTQENEKKLLEKFHKFDGRIVERVVNDHKAYIIIEKNGWYRMEKNQYGIWKLGWLARQ